MTNDETTWVEHGEPATGRTEYVPPLVEEQNPLDEWSAACVIRFVDHVTKEHGGEPDNDCQTCVQLVVAGEWSAKQIRANRDAVFAKYMGPSR